MKFYLVRHGETDWNKLGKFQGSADVKLNERGMAQAKESGLASAAWGHSAVYYSPLSRTMRVAEEIGRVSQAPLFPRPGLKELDLGDLEGVSGEEMRRKWPSVYNAWRDNPEAVSMPNGESLAQLQGRAWDTITDIEESHGENESIVVVSHNFAIRSIICALLGVPLANFHRMSLGLGSICTFDSDARGRRLTAYNSTDHLSPENR